MDDHTMLQLLQARCHTVGTEQSGAMARLLEKSYLRGPVTFRWRVNQIKDRLRALAKRRLDTARHNMHPFWRAKP